MNGLPGKQDEAYRPGLLQDEDPGPAGGELSISPEEFYDLLMEQQEQM